jgi:hypothetical protein
MTTPIQISLFKKSPKSLENDQSEKGIQLEQKNSNLFKDSNKRQNLQPVVLLQRLNISEIGGNHIERSKGRNIEREVLQFELIISNSYECSFCDDASFCSEELLNQHLVNFHHISKKKKSPIKTLDKGFIKNIETLLSKDIEELAKKNSNKNIGTLSLKNVDELSKRRDGHSSNKNIGTHSNKNIGSSPNKNIETSSNKNIGTSPNKNIETSSNRKPQCFVCALEFSQQSTLTLHLQKVHQIQLEVVASSKEEVDSQHEGGQDNHSETLLENGLLIFILG